MRVWLVGFWDSLPFVGRLLAITCFSLLLAGTTLLFVFASNEARDANADLAAELRMELEVLPDTLADALVIGDFASLKQHLDLYTNRLRVAGIHYVDASSGKVLQSHDSFKKTEAPAWFVNGLGFRDLSGKEEVSIGGHHYGTITVIMSAQGIAQRAWKHILDQSALLLMALGCAFLCIWLLLLSGLTPLLKRLENGAKAIACGALETRLTVEGSPELRHLITTFNNMAETTQQAQQRLNSSNAELQRFAEVTAHHFQEPVRRMASYAGRLSTQLAGRINDAETQLSLDYIDQQARRMKNLLCDIGLYLAAGQPRGKIVETDANQAAAHAQTSLSDLIASRTTAIAVGNLPKAWIDSPRLTELFEVALENALLYGATRIIIDGEIQHHRVRYRVSDNGPGIEECYRERVFRMFERLSSDGEGTGIGLAILRRIAQSCGGAAWIEETPGGGCTLCFELAAEKIS